MSEPEAPPSRQASRVRRLLGALLPALPPVVAALLQSAIWPFVGPHVWFLLFYPAVFVSAWLGGVRGSLLGGVVSSVLVWWLFVPPVLTVAKDPRHLLPFGVFLGLSTLFGVFHERLRTAQRVRAEAEERFELALRGADLATWDWNVQTGEVVFNARWAEMRGFRLEEIKPHVESWVSGVHPDDLPRVQQALTDYFEGRRTDYESEHRVRTKGGDWLWILDHGKVFTRDEQGRPLRMVGTELDITRSKQLERSILESQADLTRAQTVAGVGSWRLDVRRNVLLWSDEAHRIFGVARGTPMTYEGFLACIHPDDRAYVDREWKAALKGQPYDIEHRVVEGGVVRWVREKADLEFDDQGVLLGGIGITQDITARKQAEDALRLSEARASGIVSISADAIISLDDHGRITMFNEGAEKIFGYAREEAIGAPLDILIPERLRAVHHQYVERFAAGEQVARRMGERGATIIGLRKNGEEFPADASISKLDVGGRRLLTVALRDVSDQKRIEDEQRFLAEVGPVLATTLDDDETLTAIARLGVRELADYCVVDVASEKNEIQRQRVVSRDPARKALCEQLLRIPLDRSRPHLVSAALERKKAVLLQRLTPESVTALAQNEAHARALRALDPRSLITVPMLAHGKVLGAIALISSTRVYGPADVRLAEELALRAALAVESARLYLVAQRAVRARDDVLGVVAHDLRNPLGAIVVQAGALRRGGADPERARKSVDAIERAATRMKRLIQDLLDVTRMEAGRLLLEPSRLSAAQIVSDAVDAESALAAEASIELRLDVGHDLPELWADHDRVQQVFENLIGNAIKFTQPGGRISVGATLAEGEVVFSVSDTGEGIAAENLPHVFDRFWQAHKGELRGAGLGLPIVKGIVEGHGGRIWVDSTPGRGSTFYFTIPTAPRPGDRHPEPAPHGP